LKTLAAKIIISAVLISLFLIEVFYNFNTLQTGANLEIWSIQYFIAGIMIGILPLMQFKSEIALIKWPSTFNKLIALFNVVMTFLILFGVFFLAKKVQVLYHQTPLNYKLADMLPVMKVMNLRFLEGNDVYTIIPEIWGGMHPIYLPTMWIPYMPAVFFDFDIRWISFFLLCSAPLLLRLFSKQKIFSIANIVAVVLFYVFLKNAIETDARLLVLTEEPIIIFYYTILGIAIYKNNLYLLSIAIVLCLLSRFSFIGWLVSFGVYYFFAVDKKSILRVSIGAFILAITVMCCFQGFSNVKVFSGLSNNYLHAVTTEKWKYEPLIQQSLGLAKFISYDKLYVLHRVHIISIFLLPALMLLLAYRFKHTNKINTALLGLCCLKISLVFFYNLLIIPFSYLFLTSTALSIVVIHSFIICHFGNNCMPNS
jgi:hypothetical protein